MIKILTNFRKKTRRYNPKQKTGCKKEIAWRGSEPISHFLSGSLVSLAYFLIYWSRFCWWIVIFIYFFYMNFESINYARYNLIKKFTIVFHVFFLILYRLSIICFIRILKNFLQSICFAIIWSYMGLYVNRR